MPPSKVIVRGMLLLMLSVGILAAPLVLTVGATGKVLAEQPPITAGNALQPPRATSTPRKAAAGNCQLRGARLWKRP